MKDLINFFRQRLWLMPVMTVIVVYLPLFRTYFEQDEWRTFGDQIIQFTNPNRCITLQRPLTCYTNVFEWHFFGTHAPFYAAFSIFLTILIALLLARVLLRWGVSTFRAYLAASLFPLFATGSHAITWFGAFSSSLPAYLFALLSIDLFIQYLEKPNWRLMFGSAVSLFVAFYFKEDMLWAVPLLPITWFCYLGFKKTGWSVRSFFRSLSLLGLATAAFLLMERSRQLQGPSFATIVSTTSPHQYLLDVVKSAVYLPFTQLGMVVVNNQYIRAMALGLHLSNTIIALAVTLFFLGLGVLAIVKTKDSSTRWLGVWLLSWTLLSFCAYAIFGKLPEFMELRYYFPAQAPVAALLVVFLFTGSFTMKSWQSIVRNSLLALLILVNMYGLETRVAGSVTAGTARKQILEGIAAAVTPKPSKVVVYTEAVEPGFNGAPVPILPLLSGPGYSLMVLLNDKTHNYAPFIDSFFLWDWLEQGYKQQDDGTGFGYFRDYDAFVRAVNDNHIPIESLFAFHYENGLLKNMTESMRARLTAASKPHLILKPENWSVISSAGEAAPGLVTANIIDNNPSTLWAGYHNRGDYLEFDLKQPYKNVDGLTLHSAGVSDSIRNYKVEYSSDGTNWQEAVSETSKIEGLNVDIYFSPKTVQKLRITQTKTLATSYNWTVAGIDIYQEQP